MKVICLVLMLLIVLVYVDFAFWYSAWANERYDKVFKKPSKKRFKGVFCKFWDWVGDL